MYPQGNRLYRLGVPVNARDGRGHSALHLAVMFGHADVVKLLLEFSVSTRGRVMEKYQISDICKHDDISELLVFVVIGVCC